MADKDEIHIEDDDARAAETTGVMRYVLGISLLLAIIAMSVVWLVPALMEGDVESAPNAPDRIQEQREDGVPEDEIEGEPEPMETTP